jgi:hypothetical protein
LADKNRTEDDVGALFFSARDWIIVGEERWQGNKFVPLDYSNAIQHEVGHALDKYLGYPSQSPEFRKCHEEDLNKITPEMRLDLKPIFLTGKRGRQETFAELFARKYRNRLTGGSLKVSTVFPSCERLLECMFPPTVSKMETIKKQVPER